MTDENKDLSKIVNEKNDIKAQNKTTYSNVYKILLYSFKDGNKPYYVEDEKLEDVFRLMGSILATVVDCNHIKEIKTGKIIPIVNLAKNNDYWTSSVIMYDYLTEDDTLFTISQNQILFPDQITFRDLNTYLNMENKDMEEIIQKWQGYNKKYVKK